MKCLTYLIFLSLYLLTSCSSFSTQEEPKTIISFDFNKHNSDADYETSMESFEWQLENKYWNGNPETFMRLYKRFYFNAVFENGESANISISLIKDDVLANNLEEYGQTDNSGKFWHYKSAKEMVSEFYDQLDKAEVTVNNTVSFFNKEEKPLDLTTEIVEYEGNEFIIVKLRFSTFCYGWFDPQGDWMEYYEFVDAEYSFATKFE